MGRLYEASESAGRLEQLTELREILACAIDECGSMRDLAALSKQYRDTIREIEEIEKAGGTDDEIAEILQARESDGKPGAVRKSRAGL